MTDEALARAEENFAAAKEACRTGHSDAEGVTCTYGGMSAAHGYWLASEDCGLSHGEVCDLRAVCDGAETVTGFRGREGTFLVDDWIWRATACQPCADLYVAAHPEWSRPDPDEPKPTYDEIMARLHAEVEADRAAMSPAEREASDMVTNLMLYGQYPAPSSGPTKFTGFGGVLDDAVALTPLVEPIRDRAPDRRPTAFGYIMPPDDSPEGQALWNEMLHGAPKPELADGTTPTGLFDALGGVTPASPQWPAGVEAGEWSLVRSDEIVLPDPGYVGRLQRNQAPAPRRTAGRNPQVGCRKVDGTTIHGRPHSCPKWMRG